jgi:hypothetical protein
MAKLKVSPEFLAAALFPGVHGVRIDDADYDQWSGCVELVISGYDVPDVAEVIAITHLERRRVVFEPAKPLGPVLVCQPETDE